ncbi:hypothetical protein O988_07841 [Pseudogymnoascus sp. VKM F-3808]|nr:hypothetical protein O988_07841 [Pseudogymnoascus sp. VKM F-3808]
MSSKRQTREGWRCRMFRIRYLATLSTGAQHVARGSGARARSYLNPIYDEAYNAVIAIPMPTFWPTIEI